MQPRSGEQASLQSASEESLSWECLLVTSFFFADGVCTAELCMPASPSNPAEITLYKVGITCRFKLDTDVKPWWSVRANKCSWESKQALQRFNATVTLCDSPQPWGDLQAVSEFWRQTCLWFLLWKVSFCRQTRPPTKTQCQIIDFWEVAWFISVNFLCWVWPCSTLPAQTFQTILNFSEGCGASNPVSRSLWFGGKSKKENG